MRRSFEPPSDPENVPAVVVENSSARSVLVFHSLGRDHPNLLATVARYERRGWRVRFRHDTPTQRAA